MRFALLLVNQLVSSIGVYGMVFLLLMELTSSSHTSFAGNLALVTFTFGEVLVTAFAYIARDWLNLKWFNSAYYCLILLYLYFVPESPYWLFSQKKYSQLEVYLRRIATTNAISTNINADTSIPYCYCYISNHTICCGKNYCLP